MTLKKNVLSINGAFSADYPDGFHEMTGEELKKYFRSDAKRCGVYDKDRHIIWNVCWVKPVLLGFLTNERSILRGAEIRSEHSLQQYCLIERISREIMGLPAIGIRYEYKVTNTDIIQYSDLYVIKYNKLYYAVQIIGRKENFNESQKLMEEFLNSMTVLT